MRVDVFKSGDVVDLGEFLWPLVERPKDFLKMLHVLIDEGLGLVKDKVLNICQEVHVDLFI